MAVDWPKYSQGAYSADQVAAEGKGAGIWAGSYIEPWTYQVCIRSGPWQPECRQRSNVDVSVVQQIYLVYRDSPAPLVHPTALHAGGAPSPDGSAGSCFGLGPADLAMPVRHLLIRAARDVPQRIVRQRPSQRLCLIPWRAHRLQRHQPLRDG